MRCVFCNDLEKERIIFEDELFVILSDAYPVTKGHLLIIPKRHITQLIDFSDEERIRLFTLINLATNALRNVFDISGFNIGFNIGTAAGQTIKHIHCHIIPRYENKSRGGIRKVILKWPENVNWKERWLENRLCDEEVKRLKLFFKSH